MKLEARFNSRPPQQVEKVERLQITTGKMVVEVVVNGDDLYIRLDEPVGCVLAVLPAASNAVFLCKTRRK